MRENTKIVLYIVLLTLVILDLINTSFILLFLIFETMHV